MVVNIFKIGDTGRYGDTLVVCCVDSRSHIGRFSKWHQLCTNSVKVLLDDVSQRDSVGGARVFNRVFSGVVNFFRRFSRLDMTICLTVRAVAISLSEPRIYTR